MAHYTHNRLKVDGRVNASIMGQRLTARPTVIHGESGRPEYGSLVTRSRGYSFIPIPLARRGTKRGQAAPLRTALQPSGDSYRPSPPRRDECERIRTTDRRQKGMGEGGRTVCVSAGISEVPTGSPVPRSIPRPPGVLVVHVYKTFPSGLRFGYNPHRRHVRGSVQPRFARWVPSRAMVRRLRR